MKSSKIIVFLTFFVVISCSDTSKGTIPQNTNGNETPEAFNEPGFGYEISSFSKRSQYNIISELYAEALEKNSALEGLDNEINSLYEKKTNAQKPYLTYKNRNDNYWAFAASLISQLNDSSLEASTKTFFAQLESTYRDKLKKHEAVLKSIQKRNLELNDQQLLMKLIVT